MLPRAAAGALRRAPALGRALCAAGGDKPAARKGAGDSFIDKARAMGANALLGAFLTNGSRFDRTLTGVSVDSIGDGFCRMKFDVAEPHCNAYGSLHGGFAATLVDVAGTLAILSKEPTKPGVSVDLNVSYVSAAEEGAAVVVEAEAIKIGRRLAFTEVTLRREDNGKVIATGRHTKALS